MILGIDLAGTVVVAGPEVHGYRIGDDVMGAFRFSGADAEYAVVRPADVRARQAEQSGRFPL
jgi:NADPH:quinone reductase-like Zn-dependent oxidoreductase